MPSSAACATWIRAREASFAGFTTPCGAPRARPKTNASTYTIARHSLRSLDGIERLLLQVTRKNEARGYERFRDLFEAIVAYNE
jgi:hypothetical protein